MHAEINRRLAAILVGTLMSASGCATIIRLKERSPDGGFFQRIDVTSVPAGARIVVDGADKGLTPLGIYVDRRRKDVTVRLERDGFMPSEITLRRGVGGALLGDLALGLAPFSPTLDLADTGPPSRQTRVTFAVALPLIALVTDFISGAIYTRSSRVYVRLLPAPR